ncbi:MAG: hypothetical protein DYH04_08265 [Nitrospira sp. NTP2]|nr:hypothetical protein [Nitrospira sp. NTP2]RIK57607.1 MAG: hypothetical protein DCC63_13270 [Nitrospira sp.]
MAIADKLDALEQRVLHHAEDATMQLTQVLDRTTKSVNKLVDKTKAVIDPVHRIHEHPWLMVGGALCAGFALGLLDQGSRPRRQGVYPYYPPGVKGSRVMPGPAARPKRPQEADGVYEFYPSESQPRPRQAPPRSTTLWDSLSREFQQETEEAKLMVLEVGRALFTELTRRMVPEIARSLGVTLPPTSSYRSPQEKRRSPEKAEEGQVTAS